MIWFDALARARNARLGRFNFLMSDGVHLSPTGHDRLQPRRLARRLAARCRDRDGGHRHRAIDRGLGLSPLNPANCASTAPGDGSHVSLPIRAPCRGARRILPRTNTVVSDTARPTPLIERSLAMKKVSVMCFHDELCQVFNALMTALSLLRDGSKVTLFFGSRGINAVHRDKMKTLTSTRWRSARRLDKMDEMGLRSRPVLS
jgi:hypothetical protein